MKKINFWLIAVGMIFIIFRYDVIITITEETTAAFDVLPDFIGYLLMLIGLVRMKKYTSNFRPASYVAALGIVQSVVMTALVPNYGEGIGFKITFEIISGAVIILFVLAYTYGIKLLSKRFSAEYDKGAKVSNSIAGTPKRKTLEQLSYVSGLYGPVFAVIKALGIVFNVMMLSVAGGVSSEVPIIVSLGVIVFGILEYAFLVLIFIMNFSAMDRFKNIKF